MLLMTKNVAAQMPITREPRKSASPSSIVRTALIIGFRTYRYGPTATNLRDAISPVQVLHEAVTLASIADMGLLMPFFGNLNTEHHAAVGDAARRLAAADFKQAERAA